jgi:hypothetical protein
LFFNLQFQSFFLIFYFIQKQNFHHAAEVLCEVFSKVTIDGFNVQCKAIDPEESEVDPASIISKDQLWISQHVRSSQYLLQIVKCDDENCCLPWKSSLNILTTTRFLPPPLTMSYNPSLRVCHSPAENSRFVKLFTSWALFDSSCLAYDFKCPSLQGVLKSRTCEICSLYFGSASLLKSHFKIHKGISSRPRITQKPTKKIASRKQEVLVVLDGCDDMEWVDAEDIESGAYQVYEDPNPEDSESLPICAIEDCFAMPWESITD